MDDLINRQAAVDIVDFECGEWRGLAKTIIDRFEALPTVDAVEVIGASKVQKKHGKWIERESGTEDKENGFETVIVCSCCDFPATTFYSEDCESRTQIRTDFCPNCGARMEM